MGTFHTLQPNLSLFASYVRLSTFHNKAPPLCCETGFRPCVGVSKTHSSKFSCKIYSFSEYKLKLNWHFNSNILELCSPEINWAMHWKYLLTLRVNAWCQTACLSFFRQPTSPPAHQPLTAVPSPLYKPELGTRPHYRDNVASKWFVIALSLYSLWLLHLYTETLIFSYFFGSLKLYYMSRCRVVTV